MATIYEYFTGTAKWAMLKKTDKAFGNERWKINVYLDGESMEKYHNSGIQSKVRVDEDGEYVVFKREVEKVFNTKEGKRIETFKAPAVLDADGATRLDKLVGNGSEVTCKVEIYDTPKGKGSRLVGVRVDRLVPYEAPDGDRPRVDNTELPF